MRFHIDLHAGFALHQKLQHWFIDDAGLLAAQAGRSGCTD
jgi:hypothetical protein